MYKKIILTITGIISIIIASNTFFVGNYIAGIVLFLLVFVIVYKLLR